MMRTSKKEKKLWLMVMVAATLLSGGYSAMAAESGEQTVTEFTTTMTGDKNKNGEYVSANIMPQNNEYHFTKDTTIHTTDKSGAIFEKKTTVTADKTLTFKADIVNSKKTVRGIQADSIEGVTIKAKNLKVYGDSKTARIEGITVGGQGGNNRDNPYKLTIIGDTDMNVQGKGYTLGLYAAGNAEITFKGNITAMGDENHWGLSATQGAYGYYGCSLVYSGNNYTLQMGPKVIVEGNVNARINGNCLFANGGHAKMIIKGGGYIEINKDNKNHYYAMIAECATTSMNMDLDKNYQPVKANYNDFILKGNISASTGATHENEPEPLTNVYLGLATPKSQWTGVAYNKFPKEGVTKGKMTFLGRIDLYLQNGASWNNEEWGAVETNGWGGVPYEGSHITNLVGGVSEDRAGNIFQNDVNKLWIDSCEGFTNIYYKYQNHWLNPPSETDDDDIEEPGKIIIKSAKEGAQVTLITDIPTEAAKDEEKSKKVLGKLANHLFYMAYKTESNLTGIVKTAEGLTTGSKQLYRGKIAYSGRVGMGSLVEDSFMVEPKKPAPIETLMMNGGKNAMGLAATMWLSNNNDVARRMGDMRLSKEKNGLWARYQGGKTVWNPDLANIDQKYNIAQIGYDTKIENGWVAGGAFDYGTSNDTYLLNDQEAHRYAVGDGKESQYSLALYGSKQLEDGQYVDIIVKAARVNSKYTLTNPLNQSVTGDYNTNGVSISGEYGKRMAMGKQGYIEPSVEFIAGTMGASDYTATSTFGESKNQKLFIHQDSFNTFRGRLGLAAGYQTEKSNAFVKLSLNKSFAGEMKATFQAEGEEDTHETTLDLKDTWAEVEVGGSYRLDEDKYFYANLTKSFSAVVKTDWRLDAGVRLGF